MKLIDSHTHLYFTQDFSNPKETVQRAIDAGIIHMILPGVNSSTIEPIRNLHSLFPQNTSMAIGLHPCDVNPDSYLRELDTIEKELIVNKDDYSAIGETGIDKHWDASHIDLQQQVFERQLKLASNLGLPVIIHSRDGFEETYEVLQGIENLPETVFHSYSGDIKETEKILGLFPETYFGINGIVTFKNAKIKEVLPIIPSHRLLIETDAPYLAPVPHRGKTNESAFLIHTARFIADELGIDLEEFADITTVNAKRFFKIK